MVPLSYRRTGDCAVAAQPPKPTNTTRTMTHPAIIADRVVSQGTFPMRHNHLHSVYLCSSARADESALSPGGRLLRLRFCCDHCWPGEWRGQLGIEDPTTFGRGCRAAMTAWRSPNFSTRPSPHHQQLVDERKRRRPVRDDDNGRAAGFGRCEGGQDCGSPSVSRLGVGLISTIYFGSSNIARARAIRCFCPPTEIRRLQYPYRIPWADE